MNDFPLAPDSAEPSLTCSASKGFGLIVGGMIFASRRASVESRQASR